MSLTGHLRDSHDPVHRFLFEQYPHTRRVLASLPPADRAALRGVVVAPGAVGPSYPWGTVGTAFDYLVRFLIRPIPAEELSARKGAVNLARDSDFARPVPDAWPQLAGLLARITSDRPTPADLVRPCFALALYEQLWRTRYRPHWPLPALGPMATLDQVLDLCPPAAATDLLDLTNLLRRSAPQLLADPDAILNPTFAGSTTVGGADADLITSDTLIDLKVAQHAQQRWPVDLRQLVGYLLLDWEDRHRIARVGLYYARQGVLLTWPAGDLLNVLAGRPTDLAGLRGGFREVCEGLTARRPGDRERAQAILQAAMSRLAERDALVVSADILLRPVINGRHWHAPTDVDPATPLCGRKASFLVDDGLVVIPRGTRIGDADSRACRPCLQKTARGVEDDAP